MARKIMCLFDLDGTLTQPRQAMSAEVKSFLKTLRESSSTGIVGGSDLNKIYEQIGGLTALQDFDYVFAENGLIAYRKGELIGKQSILSHVQEDKLQEFLNFCLKYLSELKLPKKRGNFIELRTGMINVSPIGRGCNQEERNEFEKYDQEHKIRETFIRALEDNFPKLGLVFSIGGQISFDCFPVGWDKTFCLRYLEKENFDQIYFFGDKTFKGGNDYEIFNDNRTTGHPVTGPKDTMIKVRNVVLNKSQNDLIQ